MFWNCLFRWKCKKNLLNYKCAICHHFLPTFSKKLTGPLKSSPSGRILSNLVTVDIDLKYFAKVIKMTSFDEHFCETIKFLYSANQWLFNFAVFLAGGGRDCSFRAIGFYNEADTLEFSGLYYKNILTIVSDDCQWRL